ncbi:DSBA-like thioredoxin domain-containing protein [Pseudoneurospora amorphoporcata]|uniref:DSBA-like thioredoxin domain-containing protein n=1 Tax=Pseudoneurospora amorphoporcata TaxID=241081 RepID=A0AAN6NXT6_9PEZI|nr:DSBA-like thioredoxin domain-containing protein [Pseudoneurospora amorphoporcata]
MCTTCTNSPFQCYVGKARLERAIKLYKDANIPGSANDTFTVTWHPFYLDPSLPKTGGVDPKTYLANKIGNPERVAMIHARLKAIGQGEGIKFSLNGRIGNTRNAHRLIQLAKTKSNELENKTAAALFQLHHEEDGDVSSKDMLIAAGKRAGLDGAEVESWLDGDKGGEEVDWEVAEAQRKGIHGVPNFTINGQSELSGAQDPETFVQEFLRVKTASTLDVSEKPADGPSC